jgi:hypothetical protein
MTGLVRGADELQVRTGRVPLTAFAGACPDDASAQPNMRTHDVPRAVWAHSLGPWGGHRSNTKEGLIRCRTQAVRCTLRRKGAKRHLPHRPEQAVADLTSATANKTGVGFRAGGTIDCDQRSRGGLQDRQGGVSVSGLPCQTSGPNPRWAFGW